MDVDVTVAEAVGVCVWVVVAVFVSVEVRVAVSVAVLVIVAVAEPVRDPEPLVVVVDVADWDVDFDVESEVDFEVDVDADLVLVALAVDVDVPVAVAVDVDEAVADDEPDAMAAPTCPPRTCQRNVVAVNETEIKDSRSPASANVADGSRAVLNPAEAVTTMSPPSAYIRSTKRIPGFVGAARTRVSLAPTDVISQIWRSLLT